MARAAGCPFDPPPKLRELQEEAPLTKVEVFGQTAWMVTRYDDQRRLIGDPRISSDIYQPGYPAGNRILPRQDDDTGIGFILMDDPEHARMRRMVTAPFMIKRVEAMRPQVQQIAAALQSGKERLAGPERRQHRRNRGLQRRKEAGHLRHRLHLEQALGLQEPQQHHEAHREDEPHQHQDVAGPSRGKDVDQQ